MTKRSIINRSLPTPGEYAYIDHIKGGNQFGGPGTNSTWKTGIIWGQSIDANGWPTYSSTTRSCGLGGVTIPDSTNFAGPYTIDGRGAGRLQLSAGSWTLGAAVGVTEVSNGVYDVVDGGSGWTAQLTYTGAQQTVGLNATRNDPSATGAYLRTIRFYRTADASDLAAGKIFRRAYKQSLADLNPSAIRFMNETGSNTTKNIRFENRTKPNYAQWSASNYNWAASLPYGETTGTNQYSLSSVTGTPSSMQHGEMVTCRVGSGMVRAGSPGIAAISKANPGQVTSYGHGFQTGDKIVHRVLSGMTQLHFVPVTITVVDADHYTIGLDTSGFTTHAVVSQSGNTASGSNVITGIADTSGISLGMVVSAPGVPAGARVDSKTSSTVTLKDLFGIVVNATASATTTVYFGTSTAQQNITLQVGSGDDRTDYPVIFANGTTPASFYKNSYIAAGDYKSFYFDKTLAGKADTAGNWSYGAWVFSDIGPDGGHDGGTPLEGCTALINELMQMTRSDGGAVGPIDMWVTIPHMALLSMDPDYSAASNFAIGTVDVILNGANGYSGLDSRCKLYLEFSNETWNTAGGFNSAPYLARRGYLRWPASGTSDFSSMPSLRSMIMVQDILGASQGFPRSRLKFILGGWGTKGTTAGEVNQLRMDGTTYVLTDPLNVGGVTPISVHDSLCWAAYFDIGGSSWETTNLATIVASWVAHAGDATAQEADCANYVAGFENTGASGNETVYRYRDVLLPAYASGLISRGKTTIMYEGGWNRDNVSGGATDTNNFLSAVKKSNAWAQKLRGFFDTFDATAGADAPADYIQTSARWGHVSPDSYASAVNNVEWSGLDFAWVNAGLRNRNLKRKRLMVSN